MKNNSTLWITWEKQRRNRTLSSQIGARLIELNSDLPRLLRYIHLIIVTFYVLLKAPEKNVIAQNPSIFLALAVNIFGRMLRKKIVVDAHNGGIFPLEGQSKILNAIAQLIIKITPYTIVSNQELANYIKAVGGIPVVVPDPLPKFNIPFVENKKNNLKVLFICTWSQDEPFINVLSAAKAIPDNYVIYMTGSYKGKIDLEKIEIPTNVILTGFVEDSEFERLLSEVDFAMILTTRENCLVCGAYESVAMKKPMILSNTEALRSYFDEGVVFTNNDPGSIAAALKEMSQNKIKLKNEIKHLNKKLQKQWNEYKYSLLNILE